MCSTAHFKDQKNHFLSLWLSRALDHALIHLRCTKAQSTEYKQRQKLALSLIFAGFPDYGFLRLTVASVGVKLSPNTSKFSSLSPDHVVYGRGLTVKDAFSGVVGVGVINNNNNNNNMIRVKKAMLYSL